MKKLNVLTRMLLLVALLVGSVNVWGDNETFTAGTDKGSNGSSGNSDTMTKGGITISGSNLATTTAQYRIYSGCTLTISSSVGNITQIVITSTANKGSDYGPDKISLKSGSTGKYTTTSGSKDGTWTGSASSVSFSASAQCRASKIVVTFTPSSSVVAPIFSPTAGAVEKGTTVALTTPTAGATIYYTMGANPADPTSSSIPYTSAITINEATTIKAIAIKDEEISTVATASYTIKKVVAPTFSPVEGAVASGTEVTISSATEGSTIYYTTNGDTPTPTPSTSHGTEGTASATVTVNAAMTIKAIAVKDGLDNSDVASATYTVIAPIPGLAINFEASSLSQYTDWEFNNVDIHTSTITAHGGQKYGSNVNNNDNATTTAYIKTKNKIEYPGLFTCYISKESKNTTTSNWSVQISENGSSWTNAGSADATSMTKGNWNEFTVDLSEHSNVYVRLYYDGSNAVRAVDDIVLTERKVSGTITASGWNTFSSSYALDLSTITGGKAYVATATDGGNVTMTPVEDKIVAAGTGLMINGTTGATFTINTTSEAADYKGGNLLVGLPNGGTVAVAGEGFNYVFGWTVPAEPGFYLIDGDTPTLGANKAYLHTTTPSGKLNIIIDDSTSQEEETDGIKAVSTTVENGVRYNLAGQKVGADYKGIVIVNGKKYLRK